MGVNTLVLPGVTIGNNVIVGAGSVVAKDIPDNTVAAGVPARPIKTMDDYHADIKERSLGFGDLNASDKRTALREHFKEFIQGH